MIEIRHLQLIQAIASSGNMTKAADTLFLTQPSLSHQLKELEGRLGTQLFLRINKKLILTEAGTKILEASHDILPMIESVEKHIRHGDKKSVPIRLSTQCYTCYHWLPYIMKKFIELMPEVEVDIVTEAMNNPVEYLLQGKIDLAVTNTTTKDKAIRYEKLFDDEQVLLVSKDHPLAEKEFIQLKDLTTETLIIYKESFESDYFAGQKLIPAGIKPAKILKMQLTEARVELVKAGVGVAVLSRWLVKPFISGNGGLAQVRITKSGFYRAWYFATLGNPSSKSKYINAFRNFIKDQDLGIGKSVK
jgi:LysR family transcriptional regulator for metE and metH